MRSKVQVGTKYILLIAAGVAFTVPAFADPSPPPYPVPAGNPATQSNGDPQARVGRLSLIDGTVSFHTPDQDSWAYATLNYPVVSGHAFWTEPNSRAEIQVGDAALRLDASTEADINELDDAGFRIEVLQGSVNLHVGSLAPGEVYQIITPHETVNVLQPGTYRVNTASNVSPDEVSVLRGSATVGDANAAVTLTSGETAIVPPDNTGALQVQELAPTPFDNWSLTRDNYEEPRHVTQYISPQMTGYEDLDANGSWTVEPGYGAVWIPNAVPAGWQPYHYGHWVWVSPWGWTWVDQAPWGFAPFHYGRWAYVHDHWGWAPGAIAARPVYAPALVAFVGGHGWGVSIGIGGGLQPVGWFPLAPNEVYRPAYRVSPGYVRNVNIANVHDETRITNITVNNYGGNNNNFANRRYATVVPAHDFAAGHRVDQTAVHVSPQQLMSAPVSGSGAPPAAVQHDRAVAPENRPGFTAPVHSEAPRIQAQPNMQPHGNVMTPENHGGDQHGNPLTPNAGPHNDHANDHAVAPQAAPQATPQAEHAPGPPIVHRNAAPVPGTPALVQGNYHLPANAQEQGMRDQAVREQAAHVQEQQRVQEQHPQPQAQPGVQAQHEEVQHEQARDQAIRATPVAVPAPREIQVQHPEQRVPLTPTHEGWVRNAPQAQPQQQPAHVEAPHAQAPHPAAPAHAEPAHGEAPHGDDHPAAPGR